MTEGGRAGSWLDAAKSQLAAAADMLENAIDACPEGLWADNAARPECSSAT